MSRFRFVHAADLHLDTPFEGIARVDPAIGEALRDASLDAWQRLIDLTLRVDASFLLLAGDLYDGAERGVRAQLRVRQGLEQLDAHGIDTFIVHGNHDPLEGWSAIRAWPGRVKVFGSDRVEAATVERDGAPLAVVHGISYARRDVTENLALGFERGAAPGFHIGLLHCSVGNHAEHAAYSPCTITDLRRAGVDYWALGHIHQRQILEERDPCIVYPGNLQGRSPKPSELGPKGAMVVTVEDGAVDTVEFEALDRVRFHHETVELGELGDLAELQAELLARARRLRGDRGLIVRAGLTGRGPLHGDLQREQTIPELLETLREESAGEEPFLWWEGLRDHTRRAIDKSAARRRDDFVGELLRFASGLREHPDALQALARQRFAALRGTSIPAATADRLDALDPTDLEGLMAEAEDLALDLLGGGEAESDAAQDASPDATGEPS